MGKKHFFGNLFEKITKNIISRKLQIFERSYLESRFTTPESTLTAPYYRVKKFQILKKKNNFFENFLKKNVISQKLKEFVPSYLETRFAIRDSTLTAPTYRVRGSLINYFVI